jgi:hypothetical protein
MPTQTIGRYRIERELGRGGMATVYLAYDPKLERHVALKVLPLQFTHDPTFIARFESEIRSLARLEHRAILPVYDCGEDQGFPYMAMRYMPGGSLADRIHKGQLTLGEISEILNRIASALDFAHSQGIIHRDLKPANILFDREGTAYLCDFGIAKVAQETLTLTNMLVGTPAYMSPEQAHGQSKLDGRSDIYSLGIILFEMLTGDIPYHADTPAQQMLKHILEPVPRLLTVKADLQPEIEPVVARALAKDPADRYPTACNFAAAFNRAFKPAAIPPRRPAEPLPETALQLPATLRQAIESPLTGVREGAVQELARLLRGQNAPLASLARVELERMMRDDSRRVSAAAAHSLGLAALERTVESKDQPQPAPQPAPSKAIAAEPQPAPAPAARVEPSPVQRSQAKTPRKPGYLRALFCHFLFGFGLFYANRTLRRRWLYPLAFLCIHIGLALGVFDLDYILLDHDIIGDGVAIALFFGGFLVFLIGFLDTLIVCSYRRASS